MSNNKNIISCCGYFNLKGLMCDDCQGWNVPELVSFTKEENEQNKPPFNRLKNK